jgi:hypothetical protein
VIEEQIDVVVVAVDDDALLPGNEGEAGAQLEQESLDLAQQRRFEVTLAVGVRQTEEVEQVGSWKTSSGVTSSFSRSAASSLRMTSSGFFESAVRSKSMLWTF